MNNTNNLLKCKRREFQMYPNLRAEMSRRSLTVEKLALLSGIKYNTLREKLKGTRKLTLAEAIQIKQALNVTIPLDVLFSTEIAS